MKSATSTSESRISAKSKQIFFQGSTTYYTASLFFPKSVKADVFALYAFVRTADNFVDQIPADRDHFYAFVRRTQQIWEEKGENIGRDDLVHSKVTSTLTPDENQVIQDFVNMASARKIEWQWVRAFLRAMEADLYKKTYLTFPETTTYMYGSAEVIGLMLVRIFNSPAKAEATARLLGRAMQLVNMIRDVAEDEALGRTYLPLTEARNFGLNSISKNEGLANSVAFADFLRFQLQRYFGLMWRARQGFVYLPKEIRVPVEVASDMYDWTARAIWNDPMLVWQKKLKPSKIRVVSRGIQLWFANTLGLY